MPQLTEFKILPYKAKDIYDLVLDIDKYCDFLPWCKKAKIVANLADDHLQADLMVNFKGFSEKYRSDVKFYQKDGVYIIESTAINGPFSDLYSKWQITPDFDDDGQEISKIEFYISFKFNSFLLEKMIGRIFEKASRKMINSFEDRAGELF